MGSCITKRSKRNSFYGSIEDSQETTNASASSAHLFDYEFTQSGSGDNIKSDEFQHEIDKWLMEAENIFLNVVDIVNLPIELQRLIDVSNTEAGWLKIIQSMISVVGQRQFNGENDHIGPTIIILLLEDSPLPTRDQLKDLLKLLEPHFAARIHSPLDQNIIKQRNICTILSFLAEKFPGTNPLAVELLSMKVIKFLEKIIRENHNPLHILFALNCIEKFASSRENRDTILKNFNLIKELVELEKFAAQYTIGSLYCASPSDCLKYQIGFCAQWCLDNIILKKGRKLSYEKVDYSNLNAILNVKDKTEFIKLSSNGLSARCDTSTFECVRATFPVSTGCYYYEAIILTSGIMQIGWATKATNFRNDEGIGVGDDRNSIAFDGCRSVIWHNTTHYKHGLSRWNTGDVVGCLLDVENRKFIFYLNGKKVEINRKIAQKLNLHFSDQPYYAAASLMSYQQVYFNFGQAPFKYPPKKLKFTDFNSNAIVDNKDSIKIVPIHVQSRSISFSNRKNMCNICCDCVANVRLKPCNHETICSQCANQVDHLCPFCRNEFTHFEEIKS